MQNYCKWGWYAIPNLGYFPPVLIIYCFCRLRNCKKWKLWVVVGWRIYYRPPLSPPKEGRTGLSASWLFCWKSSECRARHCQSTFPQEVKLPLPFRGDGREVRNDEVFIVLDITDPLYLPLKRGGPVCLLLEGSRKLLYKSLSVSLFRKKSNCLSLFRGDGRGVRNDEVFIVLDITDLSNSP